MAGVALAAGTLLAAAVPGSADRGDEVTYKATLIPCFELTSSSRDEAARDETPGGEVEIESDGERTRITLEVWDARDNAGEVLDVVINGERVGRITIDVDGTGPFTFDGTLINAYDDIVLGDVDVELWGTEAEWSTDPSRCP